MQTPAEPHAAPATPVVEVGRGQLGYPARLEELPQPPQAVWIAGTLRRAPAIAIVGTRHPLDASTTFATELARAVALAGGALGIDAAAHLGALAQNGQTCVVAPTGRDHLFPPEHAELFKQVPRAGGAVLWPFPPDRPALRPNFFVRNGVLVALSDAVVVVQAGIPSGALNAASWARRLGRPLWVVGAAPWMKEFRGSHAELDRGGARLFTSTRTLLTSVGLTPAEAKDEGAPAPVLRPRPLSRDEKAIANATDATPRHADEIGLRAGLGAAKVLRLLLTLALENVVEEGPGGFFRRGSPL